MKLMGMVMACCFITPSFASTDADSILGKVRDRDDGADYISSITLTTETKNDVVTTKKMYMLQKDVGDDELTVLSVQYPIDVRSIAFLMKTYNENSAKEDDLWMYLPAFRKVRRVSAKDKRGAFMGSEFSYFDFDKLRVLEFDSKIMGEEVVEGRNSWVIERVPVSQDIINKSGYHRVVMWVDKERDILLKLDYYDAKGILFKTQRSTEVENIQGIWTITRSVMENLVEGKKTQLIYKDTRYNQGLDKALFSKGKIKRGVNHVDVPQLSLISAE